MARSVTALGRAGEVVNGKEILVEVPIGEQPVLGYFCQDIQEPTVALRSG